MAYYKKWNLSDAKTKQISQKIWDTRLYPVLKARCVINSSHTDSGWPFLVFPQDAFISIQYDLSVNDQGRLKCEKITDDRRQGELKIIVSAITVKFGICFKLFDIAG